MYERTNKEPAALTPDSLSPPHAPLFFPWGCPQGGSTVWSWPGDGVAFGLPIVKSPGHRRKKTQSSQHKYLNTSVSPIIFVVVVIEGDFGFGSTSRSAVFWSQFWFKCSLLTTVPKTKKHSVMFACAHTQLSTGKKARYNGGHGGVSLKRKILA